jgi:hypothetical protein
MVKMLAIKLVYIEKQIECDERVKRANHMKNFVFFNEMR